ncbi:MAG: hypothetical protein M2R45_01441 [Verrucomicrobia subdivision 3 bacterium]|nr:hypothetical protein [Limisphaerales bacterium]MCS1417614.1 hypothetical protein [Limisphaerales bacterium]
MSSDLELAKTSWSYLNVGVPVEHSDIILGLGSYDFRLAG